MKSNRYCEYHLQEHGALYPCPSYSDTLREEIEKDHKRLIASLQSKEWWDEQVKSGIPPEVLCIFKCMSGIEGAK